MEVLYESHSKSLGLRQQKTTEKSHIILDSICLLAGISACLTLMKSNKTVENNLYRSLNTSFSIKRIEADQTFQLSQLDELKKIKGLEKISPELETIAKLTDKEVVTGEQSIQRDDLTEAEKSYQFDCFGRFFQGCFFYKFRLYP